MSTPFTDLLSRITYYQSINNVARFKYICFQFNSYFFEHTYTKSLVFYCYVQIGLSYNNNYQYMITKLFLPIIQLCIFKGI